MAQSNNPRTTRRRLLQVGAQGAFGLSLPRLWQAEALAKAAARGKNRAKSCIFLFLWGGPSHIDTFDMKPRAPDNIRGEFKPIQTTVPGTSIVEHLPEMAKLAHHYSIIRTLHHNRFVHQPAGSYLLTGVDPKVDVAADGAPKATDAPALGSLAARLAPTPTSIPSAVMLPARVKGQHTNLKGQTGGWLGTQWDPMVIAQDPNDSQFQVDGMKPEDGMLPEPHDRAARAAGGTRSARRAECLDASDDCAARARLRAADERAGAVRVQPGGGAALKSAIVMDDRRSARAACWLAG